VEDATKETPNSKTDLKKEQQTNGGTRSGVIALRKLVKRKGTRGRGEREDGILSLALRQKRGEKECPCTVRVHREDL